MTSRIFRQAGAEVFHCSATYRGHYPDLKALAYTCDAIIVVFRDPYATMRSQDWTGNPLKKLRDGYRELFTCLSDVTDQTFVITYEQLLLNPTSIHRLLDLLGLDASAVYEEIRDENRKHYVRAPASAPTNLPA